VKYTPSSGVLIPPNNAINTGVGANGATPSNVTSSSNSANAVPLSAFTHFERTQSPLSINRQSQFPAVTISFNLAPNIALGTAITAVERVQRDLKMPPSIQAGFQGTAAAFQDSLANEGLLIIAALVTVYIVLGVLYESFIHPVTILTGLPFAAFGALVTLILCGLDLDIYGFVGIIMLIGIVEKNAIMMIDFAIEAQRDGNRTPYEAILEAASVRFRPIMMTTMAALMGAIPIAVGWGAGAATRRPLGVAVVGGLAFSQLVTLYVTPVFYTYLDEWQQRFSRRKVQALETAGVMPPPDMTFPGGGARHPEPKAT
jgi:multidrug efflux pump